MAHSHDTPADQLAQAEAAVMTSKKWAGLSKACCEALRGAIIIKQGSFRDHQNIIVKAATIYVPVAQAKAAEQELLAHFGPQNDAEREALQPMAEHVYDMQADAMATYHGFKLNAAQAEEVLKAAKPSPKGNRPYIQQSRMVDGHGKSDMEALIEALEQAPEAEPVAEASAAQPEKGGKRAWVPHHGEHYKKHASHRR